MSTMSQKQLINPAHSANEKDQGKQQYSQWFWLYTVYSGKCSRSTRYSMHIQNICMMCSVHINMLHSAETVRIDIKDVFCEYSLCDNVKED